MVCDNIFRMFRKVPAASSLILCLALSGSLPGCGYHTVGSATRLPSTVHTLSVPVFANKTQSFHTEVAMTEAVIREFTARTAYTVLSTDKAEDADAMVHGTLLTETVAPLTYNSQTGQSSSFLITLTAKVSVTDRNNKVLYQNPKYVFRQQYQTTSDLTSFIQEDPGAIQRFSKDFAQQLVSDILESF